MIELLVVIAIIGVLAALVFGATRRSREAAYRVKCLGNIRQLASALMLYAGDNGGSFPQGGGSWPWDLPRKASDPMIQRYGASKNQFYCPAQPAMNTDAYWNFTGEFRVTGFVWMLKGTGQVPPALQISGLATSGTASQTAMIADAVLSQNGVYSNVSGGLAVNRTNHMNAKNSEPEGGNIAYKDGHAEWKNFRDAQNKELMLTKFGNPQFQF